MLSLRWVTRDHGTGRYVVSSQYIHNVINCTGYRNCGLYLLWNPSCSTSGHLINVRYRLLQASHRLYFCSDYCQQERVGVWFLKVHHTLDYQRRLYPADNDKHGFDSALLFQWNYLLVLREDFQKVDEEFESTCYVKKFLLQICGEVSAWKSINSNNKSKSPTLLLASKINVFYNGELVGEHETTHIWPVRNRV